MGIITVDVEIGHTPQVLEGRKRTETTRLCRKTGLAGSGSRSSRFSRVEPENAPGLKALVWFWIIDET
jgi:hypothetical protein